jgi:hypothetical protein
MSIDLRSSLTRTADAVEPPRFDAAGIVAQGERLVRRRRRITAGGGTVVAAIVAITVAMLGAGRDQKVEPAPDHGVVRPLTYGVGQVLHVGDREIDTDMDFLSIDVTDDGAALTTFDGGLWFTDGVRIQRLGSSLPLVATAEDVGVSIDVEAGRPRDWVVNDSSGSLLAWIGYPGADRDRPELVVYDTAQRRPVVRRALEPRDATGERVFHHVTAVAGRAVFVSTTNSHGVTAPALQRHDLDDAEVAAVGRDAAEAAVAARPRALVAGRSADLGELLLHLSRAWDPHFIDRFAISEGRVELFDAHSGAALPLRVADTSETALWAVQWIDDDLIAVVAGETPNGDLLTCRLSTLVCDLAVERSAWGAKGPILPGYGGVGADHALVAAARASLDRGRG